MSFYFYFYFYFYFFYSIAADELISLNDSHSDRFVQVTYIYISKKFKMI
jgi:hypothetical protein